jgi:hypothetical protein
MALVTITIVAGRTQPVGPFTLKLNGSAVDLPDVTVTPIMRTAGKALVADPGTVAKAEDQAGDGKGQVYWTPPSTGLARAHSPYGLHFKLVDSDGAVAYVPEGEPVRVDVFDPGGDAGN